MCNSDLVHLHCHTYYSLLDALPSPSQLVMGAKALGQTAIAITDHGKMGGHLEFAEAAQKNGIKPLLGVEFYLAKNRYDKANLAEDGSKKGREKLAHLTVIAQNETGYKNMLQLGYEASNPDCYYYFPRIDFDYLSQYSEGLIVLSGCLASNLNQALLKQSYEDGLKIAKKYKDVFGDRYFIELQYHGIEEQKHNLPLLIKIAKDLDIKIVASNDTHYVNYPDWKLHDVLIQMQNYREDKQGKNTGKKEAYKSHQFWLKSYDEMNKIFGKNVPEALTNTVFVSEMVDDFYKIDLPHSLPEGKIDHSDENFKKFWNTKIPHHESKEAYLAYLGYQGLKKLNLHLNPEYTKRLKYEIETIWNMGVSDYFLIQKEMVDYMRSNDIFFGIRGSGAGSLLNYCLGISFVDPIKFGLMFERFLNPGRGNQYKIDLEDYSSKEALPDESSSLAWIKEKCKIFLESNAHLVPRISKELWILENQKMISLIKSACDAGFKLKNNSTNFITFYVLGLADVMPAGDLIIKKVSTLPDIDTDIDDSKRHSVIDWAISRFGPENVKSVGAWGTYKAKAAILGTLKASEKFRSMYGENIAQQALKISATIPKTLDVTIESAKKESPEFAYWAKKFPEETENASRLSGVISNLNVHAAAIVISKQPIHHTMPIENSKGTMCTAFDMLKVERKGAVKYDYLGLKTLRQISIARQMILDRHGKNINLSQIPFDDKNVFENVFEKGYTETVFQFSSPGMQKALEEVKASNIDDLIAVAALFRPGPMGYISDYAKGKFKPQSIKYSHPLIEKHLSPTYGIMVYQEQAMFLAREMAALDWQEVDYLRKGIAKKSGTQFDDACNIFATKARNRNIPEAAIKEVLSLMSEFGGYAFNKSHSCVYAIVGYWTAYLKNYYPSEWMAACIESDRNKVDQINVYIQECKRLGIKVMPPNVNESNMSVAISKDGSIYLPITSLKGVGDSALKIVENKPYTDLNDFVNRSGCNKTLFIGLSIGGALNDLVEGDVDEDYFIEFWIEHSKSKSKLKSKKTELKNKSNLLDFKPKNEKNKTFDLLEDF